MDKKKEFVFIVGAFNSRKGEKLEEYCKIELFDENVDNAIKRAKNIVKKNYYEVIQIIEYRK